MADLGTNYANLLPGTDDMRRIDEAGGALSSIFAHARVDPEIGAEFLVRIDLDPGDHYSVTSDVDKQDVEDVFTEMKSSDWV